jgi:hypothetical protein
MEFIRRFLINVLFSIITCAVIIVPIALYWLWIDFVGNITGTGNFIHALCSISLPIVIFSLIMTKKT